MTPPRHSAPQKTGSVPKSRAGSTSHYLRGAMVILALVLPTLSLAVLGTIWLWQNNVLLVWAIAASVTALLIYALEYWLVRRQERDVVQELKATKAGTEGAPASDASRAPREEAAWQAVEQLARDVKPETLNSRDAILTLGTQTVEAVARHMYPDEKDPLWKFTVPEALALVSRVSNELNRFVVDAVPLGDRLTVGHVLAIYRWRGLAGMAEKAYDLYRMLRFINPATAIAGELREKISGQLMDGMRSELTRRIARAYIREVGQAAIDLYSGRLRTDLIAPNEGEDQSPPDAVEPSPLKILVIGQEGVGKSSLINALSEEVQAATDVVPTSSGFTTYALSRDDVPLTYLTDSPGLNDDEKRRSELIKQAMSADAIVWVLSAIRPDRAMDVAVLEELRATHAAHYDRRPPPIIFLLSNVDRVRPFDEWQPPYDLASTDSPKSRSIVEAIAAASEDLTIEPDQIVPVALAHDKTTYNLDLVWAGIVDLFDDARNVQLLRRLSEGRRTPITKSLWRQAVGAGRIIRSIATR